jgi:hypothetical protein
MISDKRPSIRPRAWQLFGLKICNDKLVQCVKMQLCTSQRFGRNENEQTALGLFDGFVCS